jgi:hypothetical protein
VIGAQPGTLRHLNQVRGGCAGRERKVCALKREGSGEDVASLEETPLLEVTDAVVVGDSPLARSVRRRQREIRCPEPVVAGHDSVI